MNLANTMLAGRVGRPSTTKSVPIQLLQFLAGPVKRRTGTGGTLPIAALALLVFASTAHSATNWYVDSSVAVSGNGQSWATAWKNISNITGLSAGDTVNISGGPAGSTLTYALSGSWVPASGSAGKPITYKIGQDQNHNGTAYFSGSGAWLNGPLHDVVISGDAGDGQMHFSIADPSTGSSPWNAILSTGNQLNRVRVSYVNAGVIGTGSANIVLINNKATSGLEFDHLWVKATGSSMDSLFTFFYLAPGLIYDQGVFIHDSTFYVPYAVGSGYGSDGISTGGDASGITVSNNVWIGWNGGGSLSQHTDGFQPVFGSSYCKVVNNIYYNMVDAVYMSMQGDLGHWIIANNIWIDGGWGDVRVPIGGDIEGANSVTFHDSIIANNTLNTAQRADAISFYSSSSGSFIVNNVIVANNVADMGISLYSTSGGYTTYGNVQLTRAQMAADFVSFTPYSTNSNFHLKTAASDLIGKGGNQSSYFAFDKDGTPRAGTGPWDIGAYAYGAAGPGTNAVLQVTPGTLHFGSIAAGTSTQLNLTVRNVGGGTLAGVASVPSPFSIVSGGTYSLGSNQSQTVTVRYSPTVAGASSQNVTFTGGGGTTVNVAGAAWTVQAGLSFESYAGTITAPFVISGSYISQDSLTGLADGGRAVYGFNIVDAGDYIVSANIIAPDSSANSVFVNIDADPSDPTGIWDMQVSATATNQIVSWRGNGTDGAPQFAPKIFTLTGGSHQLVMVGREGGAQVGRITIAPYGTLAPPNPPTGLRVVTTGP